MKEKYFFHAMGKFVESNLLFVEHSNQYLIIFLPAKYSWQPVHYTKLLLYIFLFFANSSFGTVQNSEKSVLLDSNFSC